VLVLVTATAAWADPIDDMITDLNGSDPALADAAYGNLFDQEKDAIGPLLANTTATGDYAGSAWVNPDSSIALVEDDAGPSRAVVSLYLVEAILRNRRTPHLLPEFNHASISAQSVLFGLANTEYQSWWLSHMGESISVLRTGPQPLDSGVVVWR
jgi:hypothetical protein